MINSIWQHRQLKCGLSIRTCKNRRLLTGSLTFRPRSPYGLMVNRKEFSMTSLMCWILDAPVVKSVLVGLAAFGSFRKVGSGLSVCFGGGGLSNSARNGLSMVIFGTRWLGNLRRLREALNLKIFLKFWHLTQFNQFLMFITRHENYCCIVFYNSLHCQTILFENYT